MPTLGVGPARPSVGAERVVSTARAARCDARGWRVSGGCTATRMPYGIQATGTSITSVQVANWRHVSRLACCPASSKPMSATVQRLPVVPVRNYGATARRKPSTRQRHPYVKARIRSLQRGIQTNTPPPLVRIRGANPNHWYQMPVHPLARQVTTSTTSNQQTEAKPKNKTEVRKRDGVGCQHHLFIHTG